MLLWIEIMTVIGVIAVAVFGLAVLRRASALRRAYEIERESSEAIRERLV